jgi:hypothetical protein
MKEYGHTRPFSDPEDFAKISFQQDSDFTLVREAQGERADSVPKSHKIWKYFSIFRVNFLPTAIQLTIDVEKKKNQ